MRRALVFLVILGSTVETHADDARVAAIWGAQALTDPREGFRNAVEVSAGGNFTVIRRADGSFSQIGVNAFGQSNLPFDAVRLSRVDVGPRLVSGIAPDGTLRVWGGAGLPPITPPSDLGPVSAVATGGSHVLVLTAAGNMRAFGLNTDGQTSVPIDVVNGARMIGAGDLHSLAVRADGIPRCWGSNTYGQTQVPPYAVVMAAAGLYHNIAVRADGVVLGWGFNGYGQCSAPDDVGQVMQLSAGAKHSVALRTDGTLRMWGGNPDGQLDAPANLGLVVAVDCGANHTVALRTDGTVAAWGDPWGWQSQTANDVGPIASMSFGRAHAAVRCEDGRLLMFGENLFGQSSPPANLGAVEDARCGADFTTVLTANGQVFCFGLNDSGQCNVPANLGTVAQIATGTAHVLARRLDGTVAKWGSTLAANPPANLGAVQSVAAGGRNSGAIRLDGSARYWGSSSPGGTLPPPAVGSWSKVVFGTSSYSEAVWILRSDGMEVASYPTHSNGIPKQAYPVADLAVTTSGLLALRNDGQLFRVWNSAATPGEAAGPGITTGVTAVFAGHQQFGLLRVVPADLDRDGRVGPRDLTILLAAWGTGGSLADLDASGVVGGSDLAILLQAWSLK